MLSPLSLGPILISKESGQLGVYYKFYFVFL